MSSSPTEQLTEVTMPQMGVSVAEGTIVEWRKRRGDWVEADEPVVDVSTDKVDVEIPSPASGRLVRILVEPGETVAVGTPLAEIDTAATPGEAHPEESQAADSHPDSHAAPSPPEESQAEIDRSGFHSPIVRRIAEKHGVDLARVHGTGVGGRIRKRDVLAHIEASESAPAEPVLHTESPYRPDDGEPPTAPGAPRERREQISVMRSQIARHMVDSRRTAAHCTTIVEVDFSTVASRRRELRTAMQDRGVPLTYLAFVAQATVRALHAHPILNASIDAEEIVYHDEVHLGIAVALDGGLIVPVIRNAERLSLEGLAAAIADAAARARAGDLKPDDVHGGTFTITNPGQFGGLLATPIINQPQVAILDVEAVVKRPVVVTVGDDDAIAIRPMAYLCMSWDHRALDGMEAARFLGRVRDDLERGDRE